MFWQHTKVCLDNSSRCVRVTHEKVCICTHLCVCCFEDVKGVLQGTNETLTSLAILFPINCTEMWQKRLASIVIQTSETWNVQRNRYWDSIEITEWLNNLIGQFGKYHKTPFLSPQILHKHCFCFLLGPLWVPRETGNNAYAKSGGTNKEYYGIFWTGLLAKWFGKMSIKLIEQ